MTRALLLYSPELGMMAAARRPFQAAWRAAAGSVAGLAGVAVVAWLVAGRSPERFRILFILLSACLFLAALAPVSQRALLVPPAGPPLPVAPYHLLVRWFVLAASPFAMWWGAASAGLLRQQLHPAGVIAGAWLIDVTTAALMVMLVAAVRWHLATYLPSEVRKVVAVVAGALLPAAGLIAAAAALWITTTYIITGVFISEPIHRAVMTLLDALREPPPMLLAWRESLSFGAAGSFSMLFRLRDAAPSVGVEDVMARGGIAAVALLLTWRIARWPEPPQPVSLRYTRISERFRSVAFRRIRPPWLRVPMRLAWVAYGRTIGATVGITTLLFALVFLRLLWDAWQSPPQRYAAVATTVGVAILAFGAHGGWPLVELLAGGGTGRRELMRTLPINAGRLISIALTCGVAIHQVVVAVQGALWGRLAGLSVADAVTGGVGAAAITTACVLVFAARTIRSEFAPHRAAFAIAAMAIAAAHIEALSRWPVAAVVAVELALMIGAVIQATRSVRVMEASRP